METQQQLEKLTLTELFERIAGKAGDENSSDRAFRIFHLRYKQRLGNLCKEVSLKKATLYQGLALEIFRRTLTEVFKKASTYSITGRNINKKEEDLLVLSWMGAIAQQLVDVIIEERDTFRRVHVLVPDYFEHIETIDDEPFNSYEALDTEENYRLQAEKLKSDKKKLDVALARLKKRDREILLEFFKPKGIRKYLTKERIAYLCRHWNITEDNLYQIKLRAFKKLSGIFLEYEKEQDKSQRSFNAGS